VRGRLILRSSHRTLAAGIIVVVEGFARWEESQLERRHAVYAMISTLEGPPELMDESLRLAREGVLPQGRLMEGFKGMIALGDRHSGRTLGITFWESEEANFVPPRRRLIACTKSRLRLVARR
jgi:hypothetical protein